MIDISVIVPIYNEEGNLLPLYERLKKVISDITPSHEFIFVNDGSSDRSMEIIKSLAEADAKVRYINLSRNFGHQNAVSAGIDYTKGEAVVIIDGDLQDPPELIAPMYEKLQRGYEVVYAKRKSREGESFMKKFTAKIFYRLLARMTSFSIPVDTGDFRIIHRKVAEALRRMPETNKFLRGQIAWIGYKQTFIEYERAKRHAGKTGYTYKKMISFALNGITGFSNVPIKFVTLTGFFVSGVAFFMILYSFYVRYYDPINYERGWASLMTGIMFLGGVQLISIGILGEYISRINNDVRKRPLYFIQEHNLED
ncbi:MAG: glycosyltransferase family 2 protein [Bernardetiaceae bacterium]|nr:glycosyltransferase family 2 protein [Bernardetiaceae bacterium]